MISKKTYYGRLFFWSLIMTMALRSLISPGFMLSVNEESPLGISITFCEGLNGSSITTSLNDQHTDHKQSSLEGFNPKTGDYTANQTCGSWATSSIYLQVVHVDLSELLEVFSEQYPVNKYQPNFLSTIRSQQHARAPPLSS